MSDLPQFVGPFEVRDRLGHGGMGMVYLAHDPMLDRPVAVKVLRVPDDETRRRFLREARLHAKVQHPHIVNIYAVGEYEGQPYLAMEYIAGSTLAAIIRSGDEVPLARKVTWLAELSAGLDHAHHYGIVHRDVKPSNILITRETGRLRLLDFGIAHGQEALGMTVAGMVIGTPQYMSPEQITGKPVDARSDIFSVGLVGYELLTGRQAFGGDNVFDISRRIVGEPPESLVSQCRDVPMSLVRIVEKCLEKSPDDRYKDARVLERELLTIARRLDPDHTMMSVPITAPTVVLDAADSGDDPSTAAAAIGARVREAVDAGRLAEAEQLLRDLQSRHARAPGVSGLRVLVEEARQASQAVNLAADAERALAKLHLTEAQALISDIERLAPSWDGLAALRQQLQSLQHERRVEEALQRVRSCLDAEALEEAEPALRQLAALAPRHEALTELRSRYHLRIAAQQAASLASRARGALQQDELDDAAALVAEALAIAPGNDEARAVQELVGQRRRAQRVTRAAQKVVAALEAGQPVSARRALDQLQRMDAAHPDLEALRNRVERLERGEEPDSTAGLHRTGPAGVAAGVEQRHEPPPRQPAPAAALMATAGTAMSLPGPVGMGPSFDEPDTDDHDLHISRAELPVVDGSSDHQAPKADRRIALLVAAAVLALAIGGGGYYWFALRPAAGTAQAATPAAATPGDGIDGEMGPPPPTDGETAAAVDASDAAATPVVTTTSAPIADAPAAAAPPPREATRPSTADALARVQQLAGTGRFPDAFAALSSVPGLSAEARQVEERRVAETARTRADVARRTAADFRAGATDAYVQGMSRQTLGEQHFKAGRMRDAVSFFARAAESFELALSARAAAAGVPAPTVPAVPTPPDPRTAGGAAAPANPPGSQTSAPPAATGAGDMSKKFTREQVEAVIGRYRQAYEARNVDGLRRVWPSMDPTSERRLRGTFGIPGELQWIPVSQKVVWQGDRATVMATVLSISPLPEGQDKRQLTVTLDVVPQGDGLVIASLRQQ